MASEQQELLQAGQPGLMPAPGVMQTALSSGVWGFGVCEVLLWFGMFRFGFKGSLWVQA